MITTRLSQHKSLPIHSIQEKQSVLSRTYTTFKMQFINTLGALAALTTAGVAQSTLTQPIPFVLTLNYTATSITDPRLNISDFFTPAVSYANSKCPFRSFSFSIQIQG